MKFIQFMCRHGTSRATLAERHILRCHGKIIIVIIAIVVISRNGRFDCKRGQQNRMEDNQVQHHILCLCQK